jgi:hypothetical protein
MSEGIYVRNFLTHPAARLLTRSGRTARLSQPGTDLSIDEVVRRQSDQESCGARDHGDKAMLALSRRIDEEIVIDEQIRVVVSDIWNWRLTERSFPCSSSCNCVA